MDINHDKPVIRAIDDLGNGTGDIERLDKLSTPDVINHAAGYVLASGSDAGPMARCGTTSATRRLQQQTPLAITDIDVVYAGARQHGQ